ncbi:MAG: zinc ribbon domain-containing protein [Myxococcales bacterium]|nr:zinc ribbon domain-containing protein [Myxococcales bacterium]
MPVYEYRCNACGHEFEEWQKMADEPIKTCPKCNKKKVERLISLSAFHLKGGGWYSDLYSSSKGDKKADSASSSSEGKTEAKSETKSDAKADSKPAAKAESKSKKAAAK